MKSFLPIVCLLCISQNILSHSIKQALSPYYSGISYQDILNVDGSCFPLDSCLQSRTEDPIIPSPKEQMCSCNTQCWEYGTCCIDSPYRRKTPNQKCIDTKDEFEFHPPYKRLGTYMLYRCPDNTNSDSVWNNLCEKEWSGEDDILMISPVSSLETNLTYKNYYCFRCHETTDNYISWSLFMQSVYNISTEKRDYSLSYNNAENTWMVGVDDNRISIPTNVSFEFPIYAGFERTTCDVHMISDCADTWTDEWVRDKCLAYYAVVHQELSSYKNVHCALCNYVSLDNLTCLQTTTYEGALTKEIFSFRHLLNLNFGDDKVGNNEKCDNGNLWDPYSKKCRKISCANPEYVIKGNKCAPP